MMLRILLARQRGQLLGWGIGLFLYFAVIGVSYLVVKDQPSYDELWESLPPSVRDAFGGARSITSPGGYLESQGTSLLPLILGGALVAFATRRLSGAEQSGELDLVLSLPVTRSRYFWAHWGSGVVAAAAWTLAAALGTMLGLGLAGVGVGDLLRAGYMVLDTLPFALLVHAAATLTGAALHRRGPGIAIVAAGLALSFLLQLVASLGPDVEWLRWLSPYALWLEGDAFAYRTNAWYLVACAGLAALFLPWADHAWRTKDLKG
jgi:ABC-2 type transport system permease protein